MIELPVGGLENVELVVSELAELLVETVDAQTGDRVPVDEFYYRNEEPLPGQETNDWARADTAELGRFRIWTRPGATSVWTRNAGSLGYSGAGMDLELVPGLQSVRLELAPAHALRFEFREDGETQPFGGHGLNVREDIRPVDHDGRVTSEGLEEDMRVDVSGPGVYEISFEGIDNDRYHPIPARRVDVRAGEITEVIVELRRRE